MMEEKGNCVRKKGEGNGLQDKKNRRELERQNRAEDRKEMMDLLIDIVASVGTYIN